MSLYFIEGDARDSDILVSFWNGKTVTVEKGVALWVPELLYDRIVVELQMPVCERSSNEIAKKMFRSMTLPLKYNLR